MRNYLPEYSFSRCEIIFSLRELHYNTPILESSNRICLQLRALFGVNTCSHSITFSFDSYFGFDPPVTIIVTFASSHIDIPPWFHSRRLPFSHPDITTMLFTMDRIRSHLIENNATFLQLIPPNSNFCSVLAIFLQECPFLLQNRI